MLKMFDHFQCKITHYFDYLCIYPEGLLLLWDNNKNTFQGSKACNIIGSKDI